MIKGIYTSASGMIPRIKQQEITANNIANVSTPGFKRDRIFAKELSKAEVKRLPQKNDWQKPMVNRVYTDYNQGIFDKTGNPLDVAIDGDGMFTLQMQDGTTVLTRSGSFIVNQDGLLAFPGGALVVGEGGPIEVGSGEVSVSQAGDIEVDGGRVGKLVPVTVVDLTELNKIGGSFYVVPEDAELIQVEKYSIQQGFLEASNVDIVSEMIDMIVAFREYEAGAKSIQAQDQSLENLFRRVGGGS
jgi:flagellar basal-body rod protein FlgG